MADIDASGSKCASYDHENPDVIIGEDCVARGHYDWSRSNLSKMGSVGDVFMIFFMLGSIYLLYQMARNAKYGSYHEWNDLRKKKGRSNRLEDTIVQAVRINLYSEKKGSTFQDIFIQDPNAEGGKMILNEPYL